VNLLLVGIGVLIACLLTLLVWAAGNRAAAPKPMQSEIGKLSLACKHVVNLPQIRQALAPADFSYLAKKSGPRTAQRVDKERRRIALRYLCGLREDFEQLMHAAQVVASLSPEVEAKEEWKRLRLGVEFRIKYQLARAKFALGAPGFPGLERLAQLVSSLAMDLERAVAGIGLGAMGPTTEASTKS